MPTPAKRTRAADETADDNEPRPSHTGDSLSAEPPTTETARSTRRSPLRRYATAPSALSPARTASPAERRQTRTRPSVTTSPTLTRSASLFGSSRGGNGASTSASSSPAPAPVHGLGVATRSRGGVSSGGGGMLLRAHSTSAVPSLSQIKEAVSSSGGSAPSPVKGGGDENGAGPSGGPRYGKGKENIPPPRDPQPSLQPRSIPTPESSRKRVRVSRQLSRNRSSSSSSLRSESAGVSSSAAGSGHNTRAADISSVSARTSSCLPSPSPSPSLATTASSSLDRERIVSPEGDSMDVDSMAPSTTRARGKGKGKQPMREAEGESEILITPPPSSPSATELAYAMDDVTCRDESESPSPDDQRSWANPYRALKARLRLSARNHSGTLSLDSTIVGREDEKAVFQTYLGLVSTEDVGLYVSGPPGTGKTALTTAVGRDLAARGWRVAEVGVMGLKASDVWSRLGAELGCGKTEAAVTKHLSGDGHKTFIILDEIDSLLPPPPSQAPPAVSHVLSKLFSLPLLSSQNRTIKLVAISNTLDLTVRANLALANGAMPQVLSFRAYGAADMGRIVKERLSSDEEGAVQVDARAAELLARKVEAQNGDLRMCLGVLSSAVSLAETEWVKKGSGQLLKVALPHVLKAFASHTQALRAAAGSGTAAPTSAVGIKIRSVPLQGRLVLVSLLVFLLRQRTGQTSLGAVSEHLTASSLYATYSQLLSHETSPLPPAPEGDYRDLLSNLETLGLVSLSQPAVKSNGRPPKAMQHGPRIELCVREEEVEKGLGLREPKGSAEEECARVWRREEERVSRIRERRRAQVERAENGLAAEAAE